MAPDHASESAELPPRTLVVAPISFNAHAGGGVTMMNLFKAWPRDRLAQAYSSGLSMMDTSVCSIYRRLPPLDRTFGFLEGSPIFTRQLGRPIRRFRASPLVGCSNRLVDLIDWARAFSPEVIYARPLDRPSLYWWLPHALSRLLGVPYVVHIMDDWPARYDDGVEGGRFPALRRAEHIAKRRRLRACMRVLLRDSAANIAISPEMCAALGERYGQRFTPFHNCIDVAPMVDRSTHARDAFTLRYIGVVTKDKELQSLIEIAAAVRKLRASGRSVRLIIHCGPAWNDIVDECLADGESVVRGPFLSQEELHPTLSDADLLVLPINFDEASIRYAGYSLQTKVPEYMASGTPILAYGPPESPNIRYARDGRWAEIVQEHDPDGESLAHAIERLIDQPGRGEEIASRARDLVEVNHGGSVVRARFCRLLATAAQQTAGLRPMLRPTGRSSRAPSRR